MYYKFSAHMEPLRSHMNFIKHKFHTEVCLKKFMFVSYIYNLKVIPIDKCQL